MDPISFESVLFPAGIVIVMIGGGVAFGMQKQRIDYAHERIEALEKRMAATLLAIELKLDSMIRLVERIDERTNKTHRRHEDFTDE